jgi:hypothetical protein
MLLNKLRIQRKQGLFPGHGIFAPCPTGISGKTIEILNWFATDRESLKRLALVIEPAIDSDGLTLKRLRFHGSSDLT